MHCFPFLRWIKFCDGFRQGFFFIWGTKKVVAGRIKQVVVLYSNDCMGTGFGRLSIGRLTEVVVSTGLTVYLTNP